MVPGCRSELTGVVVRSTLRLSCEDVGFVKRPVPFAQTVCLSNALRYMYLSHTQWTLPPRTSMRYPTNNHSLFW